MMTLPLALRRVVDNRLTKQQAVEIWMAAYYGVDPASNGDAWERAHKNAHADLWMIFSGPGDNPRMAWVLFEPFINLARMHDLDLERDIDFVHVRSDEMAEKFRHPERRAKDGSIRHPSIGSASPKLTENPAPHTHKNRPARLGRQPDYDDLAREVLDEKRRREDESPGKRIVKRDCIRAVIDRYFPTLPLDAPDKDRTARKIKREELLDSLEAATKASKIDRFITA